MNRFAMAGQIRKRGRCAGEGGLDRFAWARLVLAALYGALLLAGQAGVAAAQDQSPAASPSAFSNEIMMKTDTWNSILATMIAVRDAHGWRE